MLSLVAMTAVFATSCGSDDDNAGGTTPVLPIEEAVVWSDDFNDEDVSDWSLVDSDGDGNNWVVGTLTDSGLGSGDVTVARSFSYDNNSGALTPDNWMISPAIDLTNANQVATLNWKVAAVDASWDVENYTVYVAASSSVADLQNGLSFNEASLDGVNTLTDRTMDISSLVGSTVYVGFRHHGVTDQFSMELDDVSVSAGIE